MKTLTDINGFGKTKRMRVFAGPNGSGKTTLVNQFIKERRKLINPNRHINPDYLNSIDVLDFNSFGLKVDFIKSAKDKGWQVYLYFVSTSDPYINCGRVEERVLKGEHDVPHDKIKDRYIRSLENLFPALQHCRRAYIFDNSVQMELIAEKKPDNSLVLIHDSIPAWLDEYVLSKI
jgi:predicted ABC-type ATPase